MYDNIVSLGSFCSVAMELERIGLRNASYPFDWLVSDWEGVEYEIKHNFYDFLDNEYLWQFSDMPNRYKNIKRGLAFFHDFSKYVSLEEQLDKVKKKYERRIKRFYNDIMNPSLFIRYIDNKEELEKWHKEYKYFSEYLRTFNRENKLILVQSIDSNIKSKDWYYVEPDPGDSKARDLFLEKNKELKDYLMSDNIFDKRKREENLERYMKTEKNKKDKIYVLKNKINKAIMKLTKKVYVHDKVI